MSRVLSIAVFLSVFIGFVVGTHYYLWTRFVRDPQLPSPWRLVVTLFLSLMALALVLTPLLWRLREGLVPPAFLTGVYIWFGFLFVALVVVGGLDVARGISSLVMRYAMAAADAPADFERRIAVARLFGGVAAFGAVGVGAMGVRTALSAPVLQRVAVRLARLPRALDGLRLVQISDLHIGPTIRRPYVEDVVQRTNALSPDLIVITGDLVDGSVSELGHDAAPLAELRAKYGVYFVTGNHEYYSGAPAWCAHLAARLGVRVLRNEAVELAPGLWLAGVDDWTAHQFGHGHGADLAKAMASVPEGAEVILLAHQPKHVHQAAERRVGLMLSGHTHGGQIWPFGFLVRLAQPYVAGLARHSEHTQIYVSRGTGFWGPPMRVAAPSELTHIELKAV